MKAAHLNIFCDSETSEIVVYDIANRKEIERMAADTDQEAAWARFNELRGY
jgi:hypothetical protein